MNREQQRAAARAAAAFVAEPVKASLQAWGGDIYIRRMSVAAALRARDEVSVTTDARTLAKGLARRICDEKGVATFDENDEKDIDLLVAQGVDFLIELNEAVTAIDAPGKPSEPSANS